MKRVLDVFAGEPLGSLLLLGDILKELRYRWLVSGLTLVGQWGYLPGEGRSDPSAEPGSRGLGVACLEVNPAQVGAPTRGTGSSALHQGLCLLTHGD